MPRHLDAAGTYLVLSGVAAGALLLCACGERRPDTAAAPAPTQIAAAQIPTKVSANVPAGERDWAVQALQILDTVNTGITQFHDSTAAPAGSRQASQLRQQAYGTFQQALTAYQQIVPNTEAMPDSPLRDQFMFVMGNVGGFLNPTPDLPGDPPTLGDRIGRSLDNSIATDAALRPKLQRVAEQS